MLEQRTSFVTSQIERIRENWANVGLSLSAHGSNLVLEINVHVTKICSSGLFIIFMVLDILENSEIMLSGFNNVIHLRQTSTNVQRMLTIAIQLRHVQTRLGVLIAHAFKVMKETALTVTVRNTFLLLLH